MFNVNSSFLSARIALAVDFYILTKEIISIQLNKLLYLASLVYRKRCLNKVLEWSTGMSRKAVSQLLQRVRDEPK